MKAYDTVSGKKLARRTSVIYLLWEFEDLLEKLELGEYNLSGRMLTMSVLADFERVGIE